MIFEAIPDKDVVVVSAQLMYRGWNIKSSFGGLSWDCFNKHGFLSVNDGDLHSNQDPNGSFPSLRQVIEAIDKYEESHVESSYDLALESFGITGI